jgi:hypothetical protein
MVYLNENNCDSDQSVRPKLGLLGRLREDDRHLLSISTGK